MRRLLIGCTAIGAVIVLSLTLSESRRTEAADAKTTMIVHDVFFALNESTPAARAKLIAACQKYLTKHPGEVFFAVGTVAEGLDRPVNDRDWDVGLHIVFKDRAAHDQYQDAPRHKEFIAENSPTWKKVRVFDTAASQ